MLPILKVSSVFLAVAVVSTAAIYEDSYYHRRPYCNPNHVKEAVTCEDLGTSVPIGGGLYTNWELHYNLMGSRYYFARMAVALGLAYKCPTNIQLLKGMDLMTPWSGTHGAIAIDGANGFDRVILRRCSFPTDDYPFLCTGSRGNNGTHGELLGTLSYISLLHDEENHRWTLFGHCWNAKTPENPDAEELATSFNVFSLDSELPEEDREAIIEKLKSLGYDTSEHNLIEPDYST